MHQRLELVDYVPVVLRRNGRQDVVGEEVGGHDALRGVLEIVGEHHQPSEDQHGPGGHEHQRQQPHQSLPEERQIVAAHPVDPRHAIGQQIAVDNEKYIDAEVAQRQQPHMVKHHGHNRQPLNRIQKQIPIHIDYLFIREV